MLLPRPEHPGFVTYSQGKTQGTVLDHVIASATEPKAKLGTVLDHVTASATEPKAKHKLDHVTASATTTWPLFNTAKA